VYVRGHVDSEGLTSARGAVRCAVMSSRGELAVCRQRFDYEGSLGWRLGWHHQTMGPFSWSSALSAFRRASEFNCLGVKVFHSVPEPLLGDSGLWAVGVPLWLLLPAGIPPALVSRFNREVNAILNVPDTREQLATQGAETHTTTPEEFGATMASDIKKWHKVVAAAGIKPQ